MHRITRSWAFLLLTLAILLAGAAPALGWANGDNAGNGYGTHDWVITEAKRLADANGSGWLDLSVALLASDDPDTVVHDTYHHVYDVWGDAYGDAPDYIALVYASIQNARDAGDYTEASRLFGFLAHYYADICNPLHTDSDPAEDALHSPYEDYVEAQTDVAGENRSWITPDGLATVTDVRQKAIDAATSAHDDYAALLATWPITPRGGALDTITIKGLNRAANDLADILDTLEASFSFQWRGVSRISGSDRYQTAALISEEGFPEGADTVFVATGANWPDALCAAPLARAHDAPLLLTKPDALPFAVTAELLRLKPSEIVVLGGTGAVSNTVFNALKSYAFSVRRLAGASRYDTAKLIADELAEIVGPGNTGAVFVATGANFPDALGASAPAAYAGMPIVLTTPTSLPAETGEAIVGTGAPTLYILGGTGAVSSSVQTALGGLPGITKVQRLQGADRYATARAVAQFAEGTLGMETRSLGLASGANFPDALAAGAVLGRAGRIQLLTSPTVLAAQTALFLTPHKYHTEEVTVFGGTGAVSAAAVETVKSLLDPAYVPPPPGPLHRITVGINDTTPARYTTVTIFVTAYDAGGRPIPGANVSTTWHYKTTTSYEYGVTGSDGRADISRYIAGASAGYRVYVDVTVTKDGRTITAQTSFVPH